MESKKTVFHNNMEYNIIKIGFEVDVVDVSGQRPIGLRCEGPWETFGDAEKSILEMNFEESNE